MAETLGKVNEMKFYHESDLYTTTDEFLVGYMVWNIGEQHAPRGYIPLCKLKQNQPFEWCREIEQDLLLALPVSDEVRTVTLREAAKRDIGRKEFETIMQIVETSQKSKQQ